ncbi:MAG: RRXRR domain-containing protein [Syntrophus sp. (in: bacteria)]
MGKSNEYAVIVIDTHGCELEATRAARARLLMKKGRARMLCPHPFTIQLLEETKNDGDTKSI